MHVMCASISVSLSIYICVFFLAAFLARANCIVGRDLHDCRDIMKRGSDASRCSKDEHVEQIEKRLRVESECLAIGKCRKATLAQILKTLHDNSMLNDGLGSGTLRQIADELSTAQHQHAYARTPYGTVVQHMVLPYTGVLVSWEYAHPWALLNHLSSISTHFQDLMVMVMRRFSQLHVVIYIDEVVPGNVFRHDKGRTFQAIYWCILEWPEWVLSRVDSWPTFGILQSKTCNALPGGCAGLMPHILKTFWPQGDTSRVIIVVRNERPMCSIRFKGFLADLDGHAKLNGTKTIAGSKPCSTCENVVQHLEPNRFLVGIDCIEPRKFILNNSVSIFEKADELAAAHVAGNIPLIRLQEMSQKSGLNYIPNSLIFRHDCRPVYDPANHTLRDWMHMLVNDGVAGTEMCCAIGELEAHDIKVERIWKFAQCFTLPKGRSSGGRVRKEWFTDRSVNNHNMNVFASELLGMIPIFNCFLKDIVAPLGIMQEHVECFGKLEELVALLSLGADGAMPHVKRIRQLIYEHGKLFKKLYPDQIRPKFHHLYHIPDNMEFLNTLLACFVCERKHKDAKDCARESFRFVEHCVIVDMVNRQCSKVASSESMFSRRFLVNGIVFPTDNRLNVATQSVLPIGQVHKGDLAFLLDGRVGQVIRFWQLQGDESIYVQLCVYTKCNNTIWQPTSANSENTCFVDTDEIVAIVTWGKKSADRIRVIVPTLHR